MKLATDTNKPLYVIVFSAGNDHYGLPLADLIEVIPLLTLKQMPQTPEWVAGLLNYRGTPVLVVDSSCLMTGKPCRAIVSTRILLTTVRDGDGKQKMLGLMVEGVTGTAKILPEMLRTSEIWNNSAPYLGMLAMHEGDILQIIHPDKVLTGESRTWLDLPDAE